MTAMPPRLTSAAIQVRGGVIWANKRWPSTALIRGAVLMISNVFATLVVRRALTNPVVERANSSPAAMPARPMAA